MLDLQPDRREILEIERLKVQELSKCIKLFEKEYAQDALKNYPELVEDFLVASSNSEKDIKESLRNGSMYGFTAKKNGDIVGFVLVTTPNYIRKIAVDNDYKKQGIGKDLIKQVEEHCKSDIVVHAAEEAIPFYEHCGFIPNGEFNRDKFPYLPMKKNR